MLPHCSAVQAVKASDTEAVGRFLAPTDPRRRWRSRVCTSSASPNCSARTRPASAMLSDLANYIGGDVEPPPPVAIRCPTDCAPSSGLYRAVAGSMPGRGASIRWSKTPSAHTPYRSYDIAGDQGIWRRRPAWRVPASSTSTSLMNCMLEPNDASGMKGDDGRPACSMRSTTTAPLPGRWIGVYLPDGSSGFAELRCCRAAEALRRGHLLRGKARQGIGRSWRRSRPASDVASGRNRSPGRARWA
jgi:hypothetical protein